MYAAESPSRAATRGARTCKSSPDATNPDTVNTRSRECDASGPVTSQLLSLVNCVAANGVVMTGTARREFYGGAAAGSGSQLTQ